MNHTPHAIETIPAGLPAPGPLYPDRCLECPVMLSESYGSTVPLRCVDCVAADKAGTRPDPASESDG